MLPSTGLKSTSANMVKIQERSNNIACARQSARHACTLPSMRGFILRKICSGRDDPTFEEPGK